MPDRLPLEDWADAAAELDRRERVKEWLCPMCGAVVPEDELPQGVYVPVLDPPTHEHDSRQVELIWRAS